MLKNWKSNLLIFIMAVSISGCATTRNVVYDNTPRTEKPADKVEIYDSAGPHRPYRVIGTVIVSTGPFHHVMDAFDHLQAEAAKMGGDALIDVVQGLPKGEHMPAGGWFIFGGLEHVWSGKVIVWE